VKITVGINIDAPPNTIWQTVEAIERHIEWMADAETIRFTGTRTRGVGTTFDCVTKVGPIRLTDKMTVTVWEPGRSLGIQHRGAVTGRGRFTLRRRRGGRTRFTWNERLTFPWWMGGAVGALAAKPVLRAVWRRNLRRLKAIVEAR
jgi:carbon monoxide dehydrogenase subunit G